MSLRLFLSRSRKKCLVVCSVCTIASYWQSVKGGLFQFGLPFKVPCLLAFGSSAQQFTRLWLPHWCLFMYPALLCTLGCSHSGGAHKDGVLLGSHLLPQNYAFIPNACSPTNPQCARLYLTSDLPRHVWLLFVVAFWSSWCSTSLWCSQ